MAPLILDKDEAIDSNGNHGSSYTDNHHQATVQAAGVRGMSRLGRWLHPTGYISVNSQLSLMVKILLMIKRIN